MQTPQTTMLDPMLGKILTAKQTVESNPSAPINPHQDTQPIDNVSEDETKTTPAEVRLVVKFIVEEHTVYKGIVRKIKQLESEELSRVVSHIAWDGAKELDKASSEGETDETSSRKATPEFPDQDDSPPQASSCNRSSSSSSSSSSSTSGAAADADGSNDHHHQDHEKGQSKSPPDSNYLADDDVVCEERNNKIELELLKVQRSESNNETSDHEAYVKSISKEKIDREDDDDKFEANTEENLVAQDVSTTEEISKLDVVADCDMVAREQSSDICETDNKQPFCLQQKQELLIPPMIEEEQRPPEELVNDIITTTMTTNKHSHLEVTEDSKKSSKPFHDINDGDSQSITEALNDCVMNVDLENKRYNLNLSSSTPTFNCSTRTKGYIKEEIPKEELKQVSEHNGQDEYCYNNSIVDHKTTTTEMINSVDSCHSSVINDSAISLESSIRDETLKSNNQALVPNNNTNSSHPNVPSQTSSHQPQPKSTPAESVKADACSIVKRKASSLDQNHSSSTGKRIRRASSHKEQRSNLSTRKSSSKTLENTSTKQNLPPDSNTGSSTSPTTATNQPPRQNMVFAKWSDNHFYPGYIVRQAKDRKFVISFLDGAQKDVAETDLIPLRNIEGKQVRVTIAKNYCYNALVHEQAPPLNDQPQFDVEYQSNNGTTRRCVSWKDIFLTQEQGTPLINQADKMSGASNFADVDLDNIIYEKRSRRIQDMEEFYFTGSSPHRTKTSLLL